TVWLAAETEGVYRVDLETGTSRRFEMGGASLPGTLARIVFKDKAGDVWIGTNQGLSRWKGQRSIGFGLFEEKGGLASRFVNGMTTDAAGDVWVATLDGLTRWRPDTGQTRTYDRQGGGRYPNAFWTVLEDETGTMWVGSKRQGLFTLDPESGEFERSPLIREAVGDALWPILAIRHLSQDSAGRLWVGTSSGLYVQPARGEMFERVAQEELPSLAVNTVYEDDQGQHWAGTDEGLCRFRPSGGPVRCFAKGDPGLTGSIVWTITEDATDPGALWFGTIGGGLCRMETKQERFECYTTAEGLPNMTVYGVRSDGAGSLWLSTNEGLAQFDIETEQIRVYTATDGLQGNAFDFMAHHRGADGRFYFGGPNGVTWFRPSQLDFSDPPASARVSRLQVYDQYRTGLLASEDTVSLNHDENFFAFDLTALDFSNPEQNQYRYRLAGYDEEWRSTTGQQPRAAYTGVPPGAYRFEVAAVNRDGVAGPMAVVVTNVRPAFWQTGWVRWGGSGLLVVLALASGVLVYRRREEAWARQRAEEREMQRRLSESRERERERIARELHDGPMQELYSLGHVFELASLKHSFDPAASGEMRGHIDTVASELRGILKALRPVHLRHLGLVTGLKTLVFQFCERHPEVTVLIELPEEPVELDGETELALYRIAQEGLNNVGRHANATRVDLTFRVGDGAATLEIRDDGEGFEMPAKAIDLARAGHFGVLGTMERADMHGGRVDLKSSPGEGTRLHVWVPI
ncbi:MAG: two-component regulator propeller domain-containing protein, partial [Bacteroidota bacterium]